MIQFLKRSSVVLVFIVIALTVESEGNIRKCLKREGKFPVAGSLCTSYYICKNWKPIREETCPRGEHFNAIKGWCDWAELYPCLEKPKRKECPRPNGRFLKPGSDCMKYFDCCNGEPTEKKCPKQQLFNVESGACDYEELVTCKEKETSKDSSSSESNESGSEETFSESTLEFSTASIIDKDISTFEPKTSTFTNIFSKSTSGRTSRQWTTKETSSSSQTRQSTSNIVTEYTSEDPSSSTAEENSSSIPTVKSTSGTVTESSPEVITNDITPDKIRSSFQTLEPTTQEFTSEETFKESTLQDISSSSFQTLEPTTQEFTSYETFEESTLRDISSSLQPKQSTSLDISSETTPEVSSSLQTIQSTFVPRFTSQSTSVNTDSTIEVTSRSLQITRSKTSTTATFVSTQSTSGDFSTIDPVSDFVCPEPTGYFPHPTNKHKFIGCVHNRPSTLTCPSNLVYNHKYRRCLYE